MPVHGTFSDDYFARYRFLLFCAKKGKFFTARIRKIDTFIHSFHIKKGNTVSLWKSASRKVFCSFVWWFRSVIGYHTFFYKFFLLVFVCPNRYRSPWVKILFAGAILLAPLLSVSRYRYISSTFQSSCSVNVNQITGMSCENTKYINQVLRALLLPFDIRNAFVSETPQTKDSKRCMFIV